MLRKKGTISNLVIGALANVSKEFPDAHQSLFPPLVSGKSKLELTASKIPFALCIKGHGYYLSTDSNLSKPKKVAYSSRVYPVRSYQGRAMKGAFLVGFEEAKNGDYQDSLFLLENVEIVE